MGRIFPIANWVSFAPTDIAGIQLWHKADAITGLADGDPITSWPDSSGRGRTSQAGSGTTRPLYKTAILGGLPVARFDGSNDFLRSAVFAQAQPFTVYIAYCRRLDAVSAPRLFDGNTVNDVVFNQLNTLPLHQMYAGTGFAPAQSAPLVGQAAVTSLIYAGAASKMRVMQQPQSTGNPGSSGPTTGICFGAAGNLTGSFFSQYDLGEFLLYAGAHSAAQIAAVEGYLNPRWTGTRLLICDGDSLTSGQGSTLGQTYPAVLSKSAAGQAHVNFGVASQTVVDMSADAATQIDAGVFPGYTTKIVLLWAGTNDLYFGATAATVYANLKTYWAARRAAGFKVIAFTITPRSAGAPPPTFEASRQTLNTSIRSDPSLYDALVDVGANAMLGDAGDETNTTYYADLVHMTNAGYAIVAGLAQTAIAAL